jgi:hypothetical protein
VVERNLDRDVLQVVLARAFEQQPRRVGAHVARGIALGGERLHLDLAAARQVLAGQRGAGHHLRRRAVGNNAAAALAGAGAHVDQPVGSHHHLRIVLDHHQRVAGIAEPVHDLGHAMHVARVQADAGFVQHEQRVDQRGAERGGQVDPLHFAARQRAALPVQRQVAEADVAQELEPRAYFVEQQLGGLVHHAVELQPVEKTAHALDRQQHQVVHRQARHAGELRRAPGRASGLVARVAAAGSVGGQSGVGVVARAHSPQQRIGLEPRALAGGARGVRAVA